jgi:uroporphyrin-3 C-methyltransferase
MQALMDPQWEALVRQNLRMLLEQAQVALLSGNQSLYVESLKRARHWVDQFSESDPSASRAMAQEIAGLADLAIGVELPELTRSLQAMDAAIESRGQTRGGE